ncbi:unnamed protein product, partial [Scytosiphon promiscuus]
MCDNGISGVQDDDICCDASCGTCGGTGCAKRPGGPDLCCIRRIAEAGMFCDTTNAAPCIIDGVSRESILLGRPVITSAVG